MSNQTFDPSKDAGATGSGFFYLVDHGIDQSLIDSVYAESKRFHGQSEAYKDQYNINKSLIHRGWVSSAETVGCETAGKHSTAIMKRSIYPTRWLQMTPEPVKVLV